MIQQRVRAAVPIIALALKDRSRTSLRGRLENAHWVLVVGTLAYAASYFARGWLAGHGRFELYGGAGVPRGDLATFSSLAAADRNHERAGRSRHGDRRSAVRLAMIVVTWLPAARARATDDAVPRKHRDDRTLHETRHEGFASA